jgi:hypothetical protein
MARLKAASSELRFSGVTGEAPGPAGRWLAGAFKWAKHPDGDRGVWTQLSFIGRALCKGDEAVERKALQSHFDVLSSPPDQVPTEILERAFEFGRRFGADMKTRALIPP